MTKIGNSNKFKMGAAAILNSVHRPQLAYYCVGGLYLHEIWHVDSFYGPTYELTIILNKNKIQNGSGRYLGFLHNH